LALHFTLPFKTPNQGQGVTDRSIRSDVLHRFRHGQGKPGHARRCVGAVQSGNREASRRQFFPATLRLDQALVTSEANVGMGASFANKITVTCP
jgi:hypothetical protein